MKLSAQQPSQALDLAYRRQKTNRATLTAFEAARQALLPELDAAKDEADMVQPIIRFLRAAGLPGYYLNSHGKRDLVMRTGPDAADPFGVLFELKHRKNPGEMVRPDNLNRKALHELLLYYFQERTSEQQLPELRQLIITTGYEWFIFDAHEFHRVFWKYTELRQWFQKYKQGQTTSGDTSFFYQHARELLDKLETEVRFTYFTLDPRDDAGQRRGLGERGLLWLSKVFSPPHLLKEPFAQDANTLNRAFYEELLYLMGLEEIKDKGRKLIQRCAPERRQRGSLLENTLTQLRAEDMLRNLPPEELSTYGDTPPQQAEGIALALCLTWVSRLLFLKLLEGQLRRYHQPGNAQPFRFLDPQQLKEYDLLNRLFYRILNRPTPEREQPEADLYPHVPYLNSSLFEPSALERITLRISGLDDMIPLPLLGSRATGKTHRSVLRQDATGAAPTALTYLLRFLDAYDFASEGAEEVQDDERPLISAAVLGLIFEKINGYRDGSFYTPGFITMYMCRHTLRRAVVRHFNERYGWATETLDELHEQLADAGPKRRPEFSQAYNELRVLDPAVGSGHFLVSALNELLAIKSELGLLLDEEGKRLRYRLAVARDELVVTADEDASLFEYRAHYDEATRTRRVGPEHTRLQSALFREKRHLIEHCLYGVDLNPNSVRICRLRLWIELLKHAYYTPASHYQELETLPNLELNIRSGNSLISRYPLGADLTAVFRNKDFSLAAYRRAVGEFFSARGREQKQVLEDFLQRLKDQFRTDIQRHDPLLKKITRAKEDLLRAELDQKPDLFGKARLTAEDAWAKQTTARLNLEKLEQERQQREQGALFRDAFEWRFEFPEVLNPDGSFRGFDAVLGNPPYLTGTALKMYETYFRENYKTAQYQLDLYVLFIEQAINLLFDGGSLSMIIPNSWLKNSSMNKLRMFIDDKLEIDSIAPNISQVFKEASVDTLIISGFKKGKQFIESSINKIQIISIDESAQHIRHEVSQTRFRENENYLFDVESDERINVVLNKMRNNGRPLDFYCDISFGFRAYDAYAGQAAETISNKEYHSDFAKDKTFVPYIHSKHIGSFYHNWNGQTFISYGNWLAAPREEKYYQGKRIVMREIIGNTFVATLLQEDLKVDRTLYIAKPKEFIHLTAEYILGIVSSNILTKYFRYANNEFDALFPKIRLKEFRNLPIPAATAEQQAPIVALVEQVLAAKAAAPTADTQALEQQIDTLVARLYGLTPEEQALLSA
ncbi:type IIG restriction enzyme/methyltransferase [Hymenobacter metallilatus]|uniref:site-specific DNA-methyltransferase (adenine-specific) n=1 Tax=Hymenobacter metallilatus TaxID=2493666 RepID=A0A3R9M7R8_9BACT|nr:TaqI-like C-terminal specificity domain-containing protein [Hymenobacter metallilatus]RSK34567.1 hypothetical protein EI290_08035 [Hymenobacter metallilatus]